MVKKQNTSQINEKKCVSEYSGDDSDVAAGRILG